MKVVILAGGFGTRIGEETGTRPKPMVEIGGKPIIWHIMKYYSSYGLNDFVICLGFKGYVIKEYFSNYFRHTSDLTIDLRNNTTEIHNVTAEPWRITLVETGESTMTGGRLKRVRRYLDRDDFCMTYGDGLSNVDLDALLSFHRAHGRKATVTAVSPTARFGAMMLEGSRVTRFEEKPTNHSDYINGGYFVLSPAVLDAIEDDTTAWERGPLERLAREGELMAFRHDGFWQPMDMLRDKIQLEAMWAGGNAMATMVRPGAVPNPAFWAGRRVLLTGHTGFKGAWLSVWLAELGAVVTGFSNGVPEGRSLHVDLGRSRRLVDLRGDVQHLNEVSDAVAHARPDIILHLAAQSLVRRSYLEPVLTYGTNIMGTVHVLEAARVLPACTVIVVTSDKCYENRERPQPYGEGEPLGGHDPYSSSKAGAEIVASAYARSFGSALFRVASARAGNVIGGGDWAADRLLPDLVRGLAAGRSTPIRNPDAIRPWQHVLEPLCGYLLLAEAVDRGEQVTGQGWNFGPGPESEVTVRTVADGVGRLWGSTAAWHLAPDPSGPHEALTLRLDSTKACDRLGWRPRWTLDEALAATVEVYRSDATGDALWRILRRQIAEYGAAAREVV